MSTEKKEPYFETKIPSSWKPSMRQYYAAKALQGFLANADYYKSFHEISRIKNKTPSNIFSEMSFDMADAMIKFEEGEK